VQAEIPEQFYHTHVPVSLYRSPESSGVILVFDGRGVNNFDQPILPGEI
jgi:hypothetical protein